MKFCKDCKHLRKVGEDPEFWRCDKSPLLKSRKHLVTGDSKDELEGMGYAVVARMPGQCGENADWFELPDPPPPELNVKTCPVCRNAAHPGIACKPLEAFDNGPTLRHISEHP